jgi:hypothetical protein
VTRHFAQRKPIADAPAEETRASEKTRGESVSTSPEIARARDPEGQSRGNHEPVDADEATLEAKMIAADLAGRTTLARAYERQLEKLRAGKAVATVVPIESAKRARARASR